MAENDENIGLALPPDRPAALDEGKEFPCPVRGCGRAFESESGLRYHSKKEHNMVVTARGTVECPECKAAGTSYISSAQGVSLHRSVQHGVMGKFSGKKKKGRKITKGKIPAWRRLGLKVEPAPGEKRKRTTCPVCDTKFKTRHDMVSHVNTVHNIGIEDAETAGPLRNTGALELFSAEASRVGSKPDADPARRGKAKGQLMTALLEVAAVFLEEDINAS